MLGQKITGLDPTKPYKATARIKTEGIAQGKGGNICLDYLWAPSSEGVTGTKDWTSVTLEIDEIPADGSIVLCMRMGNTANSSQGVAYFDNISLKENTDLYIRESEHIRLMVDKKYVSISDSQIDEWLLKLDKVYEAYIELFQDESLSKERSSRCVRPLSTPGPMRAILYNGIRTISALRY